MPTSDSANAHLDQLYIDVSRSLAATASALDAVQVEHEEGRQALGSIQERLVSMRRRFDGDLSLLQQHAEWDKFTVAFFGETNAGKSTVLEALRILFSEEKREQLLRSNADDLERYERALDEQVRLVREGLRSALVGHAESLQAIGESTARLTEVLRAEVDARVRRRHWICAVTGAALGALLTAAGLTAFSMW